tara:strand:+ start:148 stop:405 length:258 start_codon:yes stop_codon:yes gene_type:complete
MNEGIRKNRRSDGVSLFLFILNIQMKNKKKESVMASEGLSPILTPVERINPITNKIGRNWRVNLSPTLCSRLVSLSTKVSPLYAH